MNYLAIFTLLITLCFSSPLEAQEPTPNLGAYKTVLRQYLNSDEYQQDLKAVATQATTYLEKRVQENSHSTKPKKLAVIFDIDETLLSNKAYLEAFDFDIRPATWRKYRIDMLAQKIPATYALYQKACQAHVTVFLVTGRIPEERQKTIHNLTTEGFRGWQQLFLKPSSDIPSKDFKTKTRKDIESLGYQIIVNIGDQDSDLVGGYAERTYKLPNPFYFIG